MLNRPAWWRPSASPSLWRKKAEQVAPYSAIAPFYDYLMRHVNYARWAAYIVGLFTQAEGSVRTVLDAACGTGSLLVELASAGYEVSGFDASVCMVQQARKRFQARRILLSNEFSQHRDLAPVPLWCADMQRMAVRKIYDVVLCLYDSMNYCRELGAISTVMQSVSESVRPGGLLIFDVCTERNCRTHFVNYHERDAVDHYSFTRWSYYQPRKRMQINEFLIIDERDHSRYHEVHQQKIFRIDEVKALCNSTQWLLLGCYDGFTRHAGHENSDRVHFVLRRK